MRIITSFFAFAIVLFISCGKKEYLGTSPGFPRSPVTNSSDSLTGREFLFDSLVWIDDDWGRPIFYMQSETFFSNPFRKRIITVKLTGSTNWESVTYSPMPSNTPGYQYNLFFGTIAIWQLPADPSLIDKFFSMKIIFQ